MSAAMPVRPCHACGADCDWCIAANRARAVFPRATVAPLHDADTDAPDKHHCQPCFLKLPGLVVTTCSEEDMTP